MGWLSRTINSSIGKKAVMAATGFPLALFVVAHLLGNLNAFMGRDAFDSYAARLHSLGGLITFAEILLLTIFVVHVAFGLYLTLENLRARPVRYAVSNGSGGRTLGSMTMPWTGLFLLLFLAFHLARFHFIAYDSVSAMVREHLSSPAVGGFYIAGLSALTLHLSHGLWSLCQTLGLSHRKYDLFLEYTSLTSSIIIGTAFIMIPVLALFWPDFLR